jgi:hypothetical protein
VAQPVADNVGVNAGLERERRMSVPHIV